MILHSIVPAEMVYGSGYGGETNYIEAEYLGEKVLVSKQENGDYVMVRLLSTEPGTFLNTRFQPGSLIKSMEIKIKS